MDTKDKVVVQTRDGSQLIILKGLEFQTLQVQWELNSSYQLTFTAYDDQSLAFTLLQNENYVWYKNQQYVIKQSQDNLSGISQETQVTATHVYYQLNGIRQDNVKAGDVRMTLTQALDWLLVNASGYSYKLHGDFSKSVKLTDFGNCSVTDGISTLREAFGIYCYYPDNKVIHLYDRNSWIKPTNKRLSYRNNTGTIQLQVDSSSLANRIWVASTHIDNESIEDQDKAIKASQKAIDNFQKEINGDADKLKNLRQNNRATSKVISNQKKLISSLKKKNASISSATSQLNALQAKYNAERKTIDSMNSALIGKRAKMKSMKAKLSGDRKKRQSDKQSDRSAPLFKPFFLDDKDSIKAWGVAQTDKFETDNLNKDAAIAAAKKQLKTTPALSISLSGLSSEVMANAGEMQMLQIPEKNLLTKVEVVAITTVPYSPNDNTITLNNRKQNYLDMQKSNKNQIAQEIKNYKQTVRTNGSGLTVWDVGVVDDN